MTVTLPGGYTITFNLHVSGGPVAATSFPTFTDAFLGNNGFYTGVSGRPALNQTTRGTTTTATLTGITVTGPGGTPETGYAFVGADAESTDRQESITWTANTPFTLLEPVGNACNSGSRLTGVGTKTVTCAATVTNTKTGTAMLAAQAPSSIAQEMVGGGRQGVAFGVLVSTVQLSKQVSSRIDPSDAFGISIRSLPSNDLLGSANTGTANTASTGPITVLTSDVGSSFTFAEQITSGLPSNYTDSWSCTRNGASDPGLPSGDIGSSATVTLGIGDFVDCTITNTSKPVQIALQKNAEVPTDVNGNGLTDAGDTIAFTFTVTNTGVLPLSNISVSDPTAGSITCPDPTLATGDSETCIADAVYTVTAADEAAGSVTNTATASGVPPGTTLPTSSPPSSTTTPTESPQPLVSIIKTGVASDAFGSPLRVGETISYTYLVTNIGNVVLTSVAVDDPTLGSVTCPTPAPPGLGIGQSVTCTADSVYVVTAADVARGSVIDTATATGEGGTGGTSPPSDPSTEIIKTEPPAPEVAINKACSRLSRGRSGRSRAGRQRPVHLSGHQHRKRQPDVGGGRRPAHRLRHLPDTGAARTRAGQLGDLYRRHAAHGHAGRHRCRRGDRHRHGHRGRRSGRHQPPVRPGDGHDSDRGRRPAGLDREERRRLTRSRSERRARR